MNDERRAIEALRAGVPNRAAIRLLGTAETEISERFLENLERCQPRFKNGEQMSGQIIAGGFGSGKSHLLGYLQQLALDQNFIVSWVVISKETPLFDPGKLYAAAIRNATVPFLNDDVMTAILSAKFPEGDGYDDLARWAESTEAGLSPLFSALLHLIPLNTDPERIKEIGRFLSGGKLGLAKIRQWLREIGAVKRFPIKANKQSELTLQRLRFVPHLIAAAGYNGWVVLLDEAELIGRYSLLQRGRSYAELARWLGLDAMVNVPGVVTVAAITDDFIDEVINKRRDDEQVPLKLAGRHERKAAERARLGIESLRTKPVLLQSPNAALLDTTLKKIRGCYAKAYDWDVTAAEIGEITAAKSMRQYIKSWVTAWDLERLYGSRPEIETVKVIPNYEETREIETVAEPSDGADDE
ncbi:MAG: BREX system ATP-binding domain-containing protein [Candidatus Binataceae bacterium]